MRSIIHPFNKFERLWYYSKIEVNSSCKELDGPFQERKKKGKKIQTKMQRSMNKLLFIFSEETKFGHRNPE